MNRFRITQYCGNHLQSPYTGVWEERRKVSPKEAQEFLDKLANRHMQSGGKRKRVSK